MRKRATLAIYTFVLVAGLAAGARRTSSRFKGKGIPAPPEQESPWTPPETGLPEAFVSAAEALFSRALADSRGCEYREIELGTGSCWSGDTGAVKTHGWVLPHRPDAKRGPKQRFAVCWNGLVHPVATLGAKADCRADVEALLEQDLTFFQRRLAQREAARKEDAVAKGEK
jgi:hypothetical protein